jgi:hypothetical protein
MRRWLLIALLLTSVMAFAQSDQQNFPGTAGSAALGALTGTAQGEPIIGGASGATNSTVTVDATVFNGSGANDACNKIQAAANAVQSGNGSAVVDARGFIGNQPCSVSPFQNSGGWPHNPLWIGCNVTFQLSAVGWKVPTATRVLGCDGATQTYPASTIQAAAGFPPFGEPLICWGNATCADANMFSSSIEWLNIDANSIAEFGLTDGLQQGGGTMNASTAASGACTANCVTWVSGSQFGTGSATWAGSTIYLGDGTGTVNTQNATNGSCASNCVAWVSGTQFLTGWAGGIIQIAGVPYTISSVQSATLLTLSAAPGTQTGSYYSQAGIPFVISSVQSATVLTLSTAPPTLTGAYFAMLTAGNNTFGAQELAGLHHFRLENWTGVGLGIYNAGSQHSTYEDGQIFIAGNTCDHFVNNGGTALQVGTGGSAGPANVNIRKITITYQGCSSTLLPSVPGLQFDYATDTIMENVHMETVSGNTNASIPAIPWMSLGTFGPVTNFTTLGVFEAGTSSNPTSGKSVLAQVGGALSVGCTPICTTPPAVGGPLIAGCTSGGTCPATRNVTLSLQGGSACQSNFGSGATFGYLLADYISPGISNNGSNPTFIQCGPTIPNNNAVNNYTIGDAFTFIHNAPNSGVIGSNDIGIRGSCQGAEPSVAQTIYPFWGLGSTSTACSGATTTETQALGTQMMSSGILTGVYWNCTSESGGTSTDTIFVRKNGANTALTCVNSATATNCSDGVFANVAHSATVNRGDFITVSDTTTAAATGTNCAVTIIKK